MRRPKLAARWSLQIASAAGAMVTACDGGAPLKSATRPTPSAVATIELTPPPPISVRDAGVEAAAPKENRDKVGAFHIIARSQGSPFRMYRVGETIVVRAGKSVAKVNGDELVPLPSFFDGIADWAMDLRKDKAFKGFNSPANSPDGGWGGSRRILDIVGKSESDLWVVTERGDYQMWVGEAWRRTSGGPLKLSRDTGSASATFAAVALGKNDALIGLVHPYADNGDPRRQGFYELYRVEVFPAGAVPRLALAPPPKNCFTHVYPKGFVSFPTGEVMLYGQRCSNLGQEAVVARWDARGGNAIVDKLPSRGPDASVQAEGAIGLAPDDVWVFGNGMMPHRKDEKEDPPTKAYLAHFDGKKWSIVDAPDADSVTHLTKGSNGSLVAYEWPKAFFTRDGANARWVKHELDPALDHVNARSVWFGPSNDLFVAGTLDQGRGGVVLHVKAAKGIFEVKDEDPYE